MRFPAVLLALVLAAGCRSTNAPVVHAPDAPARAHATGRVEVKRYEPATYDKAATTLNLIQVEEVFSGDIAGDGAARILQALRGDSSASFVAIERVSATLGGKRGSFLLQDAGTVAGTQVAGTWSVVPGSGTEQLSGLRGTGGFAAKLGEHASYTLDYWFE